MAIIPDLTCPENQPTRKALQGGLAAALIIAGLAFTYGNFGGGREPTISIGAPGMVETPNDVDMPVFGNGSGENENCAVVKASRNVWASVPVASGSIIPNTIALPSFREPGATCHLAFASTLENWIARYNASGSPSVYRRFTEPGFFDSTFSIFETTSGGITRHATTDLILSVSSRALAASSSNSAISTLCNLTTAQVERPTINAATPAKISEPTIQFSQPWSDNPNIRLSLFETIAVSVVILLIIALLVTGVLAILDLIPCQRSQAASLGPTSNPSTTNRAEQIRSTLLTEENYHDD
jgi:hypothetical protein